MTWWQSLILGGLAGWGASDILAVLSDWAKPKARRILCALGWHGEPTWHLPGVDQMPYRVCRHCSAWEQPRTPRSAWWDE